METYDPISEALSGLVSQLGALRAASPMTGKGGDSERSGFHLTTIRAARAAMTTPTMVGSIDLSTLSAEIALHHATTGQPDAMVA